MAKRDKARPLSGVIAFDDLRFGRLTAGKKREEARKSQVFAALSMDEKVK